VSYSAFKEAVDGTGNRLTTVRVDDRQLLEELTAAGVEVHGVPEQGDVGAILGWILPLVIMAGLWYWMLKKMRSGMGGQSRLFSFGKSRARVLEGAQTGVAFDDVGGLGEALTDLREVTDFLKDKQ
jgi:cell division protease FtsH